MVNMQSRLQKSCRACLFERWEVDSGNPHLFVASKIQVITGETYIFCQQQCLLFKQWGERVCLRITSVMVWNESSCGRCQRHDIRIQWQWKAEVGVGLCVCTFALALAFAFALQLIRLTLPRSTSNRGKECSSSTVLVFLCVRGVVRSLCGALPLLLMTVMPPRCHLSRSPCWYCNGERLHNNLELQWPHFASGGSQHTAVVSRYVHHCALNR